MVHKTISQSQQKIINLTVWRPNGLLCLHLNQEHLHLQLGVGNAERKIILKNQWHHAYHVLLVLVY